MRTFQRGMTDKIVAALCTRFGATVHAIRRALPQQYQEWARLRIAPEGDIIRAAAFGQGDGIISVSEEGRNATFVRVSVLCLQSKHMANVITFRLNLV